LTTDGRGLINTFFKREVFTRRSGSEWLVTEIFFAPASNYCWNVLRVDGLYKELGKFLQTENTLGLVPCQLRLELVKLGDNTYSLDLARMDDIELGYSI
jgi:hypothetical protein